MPTTPTAKATFYGMLAILLWSLSIGLMRSITSTVGVIGGGALIFTSASIFTLLFRGIPNFKHYNKPYLFICGFLFVAYEICLVIAIGQASSHAQSIELGMLNYLWPCLTILLAIPIHKQKTNLALFMGVAISLAGIVFIMKDDGTWSPQFMWNNICQNPLPYLLALCAAFLWAFYNNMVRKYGHAKQGVTPFLTVTALILWSYYFIAQPKQGISLNIHSSLEVLVLGLSSAIAYNAWNIGIQQGNSLLLTFSSYFTPALAALAACIWLKIWPSHNFWFGLILLIAGAIVCWGAVKWLARTQPHTRP